MKPGDVFICWDRHGKVWHARLMLRVLEEEVYGRRWLHVNLDDGKPFDSWENEYTWKSSGWQLA